MELSSDTCQEASPLDGVDAISSVTLVATGSVATSPAPDRVVNGTAEAFLFESSLASLQEDSTPRIHISAEATVAGSMASAGQALETESEDVRQGGRDFTVAIDLAVNIPPALSCVSLFFKNAHKTLTFDEQSLETLNS
jgi:hypothetical protein